MILCIKLHNTINKKISIILSILNINLRITNFVNLNIQNSMTNPDSAHESSRDLIAAESVPAAGRSTTATLSRIKREPVCILRWLIAISYHCPVAACCVHARRQGGEGAAGSPGPIGGDEGRRGGTRKGADGTVFLAAKWQRARANRVGTSAADFPGREREYKREEPPTSLLFSRAKQKAHPPRSTQTGAVGVSRAQFLISYLFRKRAVLPPPHPPSPLPMAITSVSFIPAVCFKIFNFGRWHVPNGRLISPLLLPFFSSSFVKSCR